MGLSLVEKMAALTSSNKDKYNKILAPKLTEFNYTNYSNKPVSEI
jgi:hypothetical protein